MKYEQGNKSKMQEMLKQNKNANIEKEYDYIFTIAYYLVLLYFFSSIIKHFHINIFSEVTIR